MNFKHVYIFVVIIGVIFASCSSDRYNPDKYLSREQQDSLIYQVVRYTAKLPPNSNHQIKFEPEYDDYYKAITRDYDIRSYDIDDDSIHYFLITRASRSITPMRESIGGKITYNKQGDISSYEEVFRTWKLSEEVMNERYPALFDKMVKGESLEPYYTKNKGDQYIEYPTDRFIFDKQERRWRDLELDSLNLN